MPVINYYKLHLEHHSCYGGDEKTLCECELNAAQVKIPDIITPDIHYISKNIFILGIPDVKSKE